ncbi:type I-E CRISPR-associated protein Cas6/Cse3/CasE [Nocardiopsis halophila]|uniref:type I-E CRISPR-associated protein Cas6/Cse3/CasE n=1 Tax=Nocardiopsis halophila TaxID=141692 RepID=UPI00034ABB32|nr:type I-E CRISPR-associated protein Cas6/Cse3/CasE [Nocardiopsis halophila]
MLLTTIHLDPDAAPDPTESATMGRLVGHVADAAGAEEGRVLWARRGRDRLIISSDVPPDWHELPGALRAESVKTPRYEQWDRIRFSLDTKPVRAVPKPGAQGKGKSRRVAVPEDRWDQWLTGRLEDVLVVTALRHARIGMGGAAYGRFRGEAVVRDADALYELCIRGVGRGKHEGRGLLLTERA